MNRISSHEHARVLARCPDIPQQRPSFAIALPEVGISGKTVWVRLPQGVIPFAARLEVALAAGVRGIHMSRMEEVISALHDREFADLRDYGLALATEMVARQGAAAGRVRLSGSLPLLRTTRASGRRSVDTISVSLDVRLAGGERLEPSLLMGVGVHHITACPCTQAYHQVLFDRPGDDPCPQATHSQRCHTSLAMGCNGAQPALTDLLACLEEALHVTGDLLKRPDEAELVLKSHAAPQFAEDAVREVARCAAARFAPLLPAQTPLVIESVSLESIHIHDVCCRLATTLGAVADQLPAGP